MEPYAMSTKFYIDRSRAACNLTRRRSGGHITHHDTGKTYEGLGLKDLQRRLDYWEGRVADFAALSADTEGDARKKAAKLLKEGEKLLASIRGQIEERIAA